MNLHGVPRMTMDVDLVLAMEDAYLDAFLACARALGLKPQAPVPIEALKDPAQRRQWIETKNVIAFARGAPDASGATVDILIHHASMRRWPPPVRAMWTACRCGCVPSTT